MEQNVRRVGTVSRGIRCPIIREGDNPDGGHKFIRQYMLMNDNTGRLIRAMMPKGDNTMTL